MEHPGIVLWAGAGVPEGVPARDARSGDAVFRLADSDAAVVPVRVCSGYQCAADRDGGAGRVAYAREPEVAGTLRGVGCFRLEKLRTVSVRNVRTDSSGQGAGGDPDSL